MGFENDKKEITHKDLERFITKHELLEKEMTLNKNAQRLHEKSLEKIEAVESKVGDLQVLVLPLVEFSKATASNTERLVSSFDKFAEKQEEFVKKQENTNSNLFKKINVHEVELAKRQEKMNSYEANKDNDLEKEKMKNSTKATIITGIVTFLVALVGAAPLLAEIFFK